MLMSQALGTYCRPSMRTLPPRFAESRNDHRERGNRNAFSWEAALDVP